MQVRGPGVQDSQPWARGLGEAMGKGAPVSHCQGQGAEGKLGP